MRCCGIPACPSHLLAAHAGHTDPLQGMAALARAAETHDKRMKCLASTQRTVMGFSVWGLSSSCAEGERKHDVCSDSAR